MQISQLAVTQSNIVLVYDEIDLDELSRDTLRRIVPDQRPALQEIPNRALVLTYVDIEPSPLSVIIGDRRVRVQIAGTNAKEVCAAARSVHDTIAPSSSLVAYGFNIELRGQLAEEPVSAITRKFLQDPDGVARLFNGEWMDVGISLRFRRADNLMRLELTPENGDIEFTTNTHFDSNELPSRHDLIDSLSNTESEIRKLVADL